jgi:hypothetical protein
MSIKLGKKLDSTCISSRLTLLATGEVFYTKNIEEIKFNGYSLNINGWRVCGKKEYLLDQDWYYPAATYTINDVELVDERLSYEKAVKSECIYLSSTMSKRFHADCSNPDSQSKEYLRHLCDFSLVHNTQEAAVLHTKAMMRVSE